MADSILTETLFMPPQSARWLRISLRTARHDRARGLLEYRDLRIGAIPLHAELHPREIVGLIALEPVILGIGVMYEVVIAGSDARDIELLSFRRLMVVIAPSDGDALQLRVAFEVS